MATLKKLESRESRKRKGFVYTILLEDKCGEANEYGVENCESCCCGVEFDGAGAKILLELQASLCRPNESLHSLTFLIPSLHSALSTMSLLAINTVDRLDRPSAYYVGKV